MVRIKVNFSVSKFLKDTVKRDRKNAEKAILSAASATRNNASNILKDAQRSNRGIARKSGMHLYAIIKKEKPTIKALKKSYNVYIGSVSYLDRLAKNKGFPYWRSIEYGITKNVPRPIFWKRGSRIVPSGAVRTNDKPFVTTANAKYAHIKPLNGRNFRKYRMYERASDRADIELNIALRKYMN